MELYVARDKRDRSRHDLGSVLCLQTLQDLPAVAVHDVTTAAPTHRPSWLVGTPTLHNARTGEVWRGHQALTHLQQLALHHAEARGAARGGASNDASERRAIAAPSAPSAHRAVGPSAPSAPSAPETPDDDVDNLWDTRIVEEEEEAAADRKLTSDDLSRALTARGPPSQPVSEQPPPPLPPLSD